MTDAQRLQKLDKDEVEIKLKNEPTEREMLENIPEVSDHRLEISDDQVLVPLEQEEEEKVQGSEAQEADGWEEFTSRFFANDNAKSSPDAALMHQFAVLAQEQQQPEKVPAPKARSIFY